MEKGIYEKLLTDISKVEQSSVKALAEKYGTDIQTMTGFLDGINDSLKEANPIETMEEDTEVKLAIDPEKLYYNMVEAKASWLYGLPQWDATVSYTHLDVYKRQVRELPLQLLPDFLEKCNINLMIQKRIHLQNISLFHLSACADPVHQKLHLHSLLHSCRCGLRA